MFSAVKLNSSSSVLVRMSVAPSRFPIALSISNFVSSTCTAASLLIFTVAVAVVVVVDVVVVVVVVVVVLVVVVVV